MLLYFPNYYYHNLPKSWMNKFPGLHKISGGLTIALFECYIICPLERIKVHLMTSKI